MGIIAWIVVGFIAGLIARALVPGRDSIGLVGTILLGIVGSFVGGLLANLLFEGNLDLEPSGWIGSIVGAVIALLLYRRFAGRRSMLGGGRGRMAA